jgi:hypothetical protein
LTYRYLSTDDEGCSTVCCDNTTAGKTSAAAAGYAVTHSGYGFTADKKSTAATGNNAAVNIIAAGMHTPGITYDMCGSTFDKKCKIGGSCAGSGRMTTVT